MFMPRSDVTALNSPHVGSEVGYVTFDRISRNFKAVVDAVPRDIQPPMLDGSLARQGPA
jgi:hypothetical protein